MLLISHETVHLFERWGNSSLGRFQDIVLSLEGVYTESVDAAWPKVVNLLGFDRDLQRRLPEVTREAMKRLLVTVVVFDREAPWKCHLGVATGGYGSITTKSV